MQFTYEASVYIDLQWNSLESVIKGKSQPMIADKDGSTYFDREGYARIGTATVTVELFSENEIVAGQISALNQALQKERAESQQRQNAILESISKLQAINYTPA